MKNYITESDGQLIIECNNLAPSQFVTASLSSHDLITGHRWRWIESKGCQGSCKTEISGSVESLPHLLLKLPKAESIKYKNDNPHDCRLENLQPPVTPLRTTAYTITGDVAYLHLPDGINVLVDADQIPRLCNYRWLSICKSRRYQQEISIRTSVPGERAIMLPRLLLGLTEERSHYRHVNGNRLDCRLSNLEIKGKSPTPVKSVNINILTPTSPSNTRKVYAGLISPEGTLHAPITHLRGFCNDHDVSYSGLVRVLTGRASHCGGWRAYEPTYSHVE